MKFKGNFQRQTLSHTISLYPALKIGNIWQMYSVLEYNIKTSLLLIYADYVNLRGEN
jgi:hypothetical protein